MTEMRLAAEWIVPISEPPIAQGVIEIQAGVIRRVGPRADMPGEAEELGGAVVLPGLVNAHTHLELGHLAGFAEESSGDLPSWLRRVVARQRAQEPDQDRLVENAVRAGAAACLDAGVSTVGDISQRPRVSRQVLRSGPLHVVSFGEVLGMGRRRGLIASQLEAAADRGHDSPWLTAALSPHAPYSIEPQGVRQVAECARRHGMRLTMHLAESLEELQFLRDGAGPMLDMLESFGVLDEPLQPAGQTPVHWADSLGLLGPDCLIAHGNYLDNEEIDLLCALGASVVYCPLTHARFGHACHPLLELLGRGVNVCVGTDSLASNPSLELLPELMHIRRTFPELPPPTLLSLVTINGARALGLAHQIGSLQPGKRADLAVFTSPGEGVSPAEQLVSRECKLLRLYINGERVR
jgi:cytosine/adenosine deaminase-related metal-dependent hydrolase